MHNTARLVMNDVGPVVCGARRKRGVFLGGAHRLYRGTAPVLSARLGTRRSLFAPGLCEPSPSAPLPDAMGKHPA
jgi:hypothetical protein